MCEGCGVSQHLDVECSDEVLFEVFGGDVFLCHAGFEGLEFIKDDFIFLLFGFGLADTFDKLFKFFGQVA